MKATDMDKIGMFIKNNPESQIDQICVGTKLSYLTIKGAIKTLLTDEKIKETAGKGNAAATYSLTEKGLQDAPKTDDKKEVPVEKAAAKATATKDDKKAGKKKEDTDLGPKTYTGRDNSKYRMGEHSNLAKGRLALLLVRTFAKKNPKISLSKLQELFHSAEIHPRFQVVDEVKKAKEFSQGNRDRFFLKAEDTFVVGTTKVKCAVCSQWTKESIDKLIKVASAQPIGFKVKVEAAE